MHQHRRESVLLVELFVQFRQDHHGKFQALRAVNAHQSHAAPAFSRGKADALARFQQRAQMAHKGKQAPISRPFKGAGVFIERNEPLPPQRAVVHRAEHTQHIPAVIQVPQQTVHAHVRR